MPPLGVRKLQHGGDRTRSHERAEPRARGRMSRELRHGSSRAGGARHGVRHRVARRETTTYFARPAAAARPAARRPRSAWGAATTSGCHPPEPRPSTTSDASKFDSGSSSAILQTISSRRSLPRVDCRQRRPRGSTCLARATCKLRSATCTRTVNCGHCHHDEAIRLKTMPTFGVRRRLLVDQTTPKQTGAYRTTHHDRYRDEAPAAWWSDDGDRGGLTRDEWAVGRMGRRDNFGMPPAGTETVDDVGREKVRLGIAGLSP